MIIETGSSGGLLGAALAIATLCLIVALLAAAWRLLAGPTLADRVVALDLVSGLLVVFLVIFKLVSGVGAYIYVGIGPGADRLPRHRRLRPLHRPRPGRLRCDVTGSPAALLVAGGFFCLIAGIGVVRLNDVFARMHAATKAGTLGLALVCLAVMVQARDLARGRRGALRLPVHDRIGAGRRAPDRARRLPHRVAGRPQDPDRPRLRRFPRRAHRLKDGLERPQALRADGASRRADRRRPGCRDWPADPRAAAAGARGGARAQPLRATADRLRADRCRARSARPCRAVETAMHGVERWRDQGVAGRTVRVSAGTWTSRFLAAAHRRDRRSRRRLPDRISSPPRRGSISAGGRRISDCAAGGRRRHGSRLSCLAAVGLCGLWTSGGRRRRASLPRPRPSPRRRNGFAPITATRSPSRRAARGWCSTCCGPAPAGPCCPVSSGDAEPALVRLGAPIPDHYQSSSGWSCITRSATTRPCVSVARRIARLLRAHRAAFLGVSGLEAPRSDP